MIALVCGVCVSLLLIAVRGHLAQDWIPFHLAAKLAATKNWEQLYRGAGARSLFDVSDEYRAAAHELLRDNPSSDIDENTVTAFVSPPPAAFLLAPFAHASAQTSVTALRLALALPMAAALIVFSVKACGDSSAKLRWSAICFAALPLLVYPVNVGQSSAWLLIVAVASLLRKSVWLDLLAGTALGLTILTKGTPLLLAVGLLVLGRWRLGLTAIGIAVVAVVLSFPLAGLDAWRGFATTASRLGSTVITDWNSVSVDAALMRWSGEPADALFRSPGEASKMASWGLKAAIALVALWSVAGSRGSLRARVSALWIVWLAINPLAWLHYLTVLIPLIGAVPGRRALDAVLLAALLSLPLILRAMSAAPELIGSLGTIAWLGSALFIIWPRRSDVAEFAR